MIYNKEFIMQSHEDFQIIANIIIGHDRRNNLIIRLGIYDDGDDYPSGHVYTSREETTAIMNEYEVKRFARKVHIKPEAVKSYLYDGFLVDSYIGETSYVTASFRNILNYILDHGAKYRLLHSSSKKRRK